MKEITEALYSGSAGTATTNAHIPTAQYLNTGMSGLEAWPRPRALWSWPWPWPQDVWPR